MEARLLAVAGMAHVEVLEAEVHAQVRPSKEDSHLLVDRVDGTAGDGLREQRAVAAAGARCHCAHEAEGGQEVRHYAMKATGAVG